MFNVACTQKYGKAWKDSKNRDPLVLKDTGQVRKTYALLEFGRTNYKNMAYLNFGMDAKLMVVIKMIILIYLAILS